MSDISKRWRWRPATAGGRAGALLISALAALAACERGQPGPGPQPASEAAPAVTADALAARLPALWTEAVAASGPDAEVWRAALAEAPVELAERAALEQVYGVEGAVARLVDDRGLTAAGARVLERLQAADAEALDPARYHVGADLDAAAARFAEARAAVGALEAPAPPDAAETARLTERLRALPPGPESERALLAEVLSPGGPLPRYAEALAAARARRRPLLEARAQWELALADGLARYARDMRRGNTATAERLARREVLAHEARAQAAAEEGPDEERGAVTPDGEAEAPEVPEAARTPEAPLVLRDREAFIVERLAADLRRVSDAAAVDALFEALVPAHPQYRPLRAALARYRELAARGGWTPLPAGSVGPGKRGPAVQRLAARLALEGFAIDPEHDVFDATMRAAVERYQVVHQLRVTGTPNATFWKVLNLPVDQRLASITKSLDRLRRSRVDEDPYFIAINIPDYHLELWRDGARALRHRLIVGKGSGTKCDERTQRLTLAYATPVQSSEMDRLVFAPYWNVPRDIKEKEYDFQRGKDARFYEKNGYEVVHPGKPHEYVRQLPGPANALGFVKFLFPSPHATYVHDTNQKRLFGEPTRTFSHGCMRLEQPLALAEALLTADGQWRPERFATLQEKWVDLGRRVQRFDPAQWTKVLRDAARLQTQVVLEDPVPIHVEYYTARVADDGLVEFLTDIYGYDSGRWHPKNAPRCVPESRLARSGLADLLDRVAALEAQGAALEARVAALAGQADALDETQRGLARSVRDLEGFGTEYRNLAAHIREQHAAVSADLEARDGRWTPRLERRAVAVHRLVQGLESTLAKARKTCERAEAALGG